jgi:hypothetical protein
VEVDLKRVVIGSRTKLLAVVGTSTPRASTLRPIWNDSEISVELFFSQRRIFSSARTAIQFTAFISSFSSQQGILPSWQDNLPELLVYIKFIIRDFNKLQSGKALAIDGLEL